MNPIGHRRMSQASSRGWRTGERVLKLIDSTVLTWMTTLRLFFLLLFLGASSNLLAQSLVPPPDSIAKRSTAGLKLPREITVEAPEQWKQHLQIVGDLVHRITAGKHSFRLGGAAQPDFLIREDDSLKEEEYVLDVNEQRIELRAASMKGLAHGTATMMQLLGQLANGTLPAVRVEDRPQASYRNFMIDMGRNPHSVELLKETIDLLWFYKVDSLQLHLTDDQRFAWPSTEFPKLWDGKITLDEFRDLERYAVNRGVTIIPELEVPGHSGILRSKYPEVFGKTGTELATSETALKGIQTLLDEMMETFSSTPYIHIGGDEAYGVPVDAQRNLINKLHAYLKSKGRQTIVWEGPDVGEGANKVNEDVIHINWRTIAYPADDMLRDGYRVVNAAWDPLYIVDHYPRINFTMTSPQHIYETLSLTRFKHVNPGIPTFKEPIEVEPTDRLIGFCMPWWEGREENFFAQNTPRLVPFAEIAWKATAERDYANFEERAAITEAIRRAAQAPVSIKASDLAVPSDGVFHNQTRIELESPDFLGPLEIRYTLDGQSPSFESPVYREPFDVDRTLVVRAAAFIGGKKIGHGARMKLSHVAPTENLALGKPVTSTATSASPFSVERLTDGGTGNLDFYLGYPAEPDPIKVTVDLEETHHIDRVVVHAYSISNSAEDFVVEVSADGKSFEEVGAHRQRPKAPARPNAQSAVPVEFEFSPRQVRYVRVVTNGNKGYVFDSFSKLVEVQVFASTKTETQSEPAELKPAPVNYRPLAFYPDRWSKAGADFDMLAWEGRHIVFITKKGNYNTTNMTAFVRRLDEGWQTYSELIGQQPRKLKVWRDKPVICAIPKSGLSCGYGCGYVGATGIEASAFYQKDLPNFQRQPESFQHYYFYEMGRNFFVFGDRHSLFTTGYAVFMRYVCMDRLRCKDLDAKTRQTIEDCERVYAESKIPFFDAFTNLGAGEKANRLRNANGRIISPSDQPVMYATAMLKLRRDFGGDEWVKRFFHELRRCQSKRAVDVETASTQVFNWLVCASIAAKQDLSPVFVDRWRLPMSERQRRVMRQTEWTDVGLDPSAIVEALLAEE